MEVLPTDHAPNTVREPIINDILPNEINIPKIPMQIKLKEKNFFMLNKHMEQNDNTNKAIVRIKAGVEGNDNDNDNSPVSEDKVNICYLLGFVLTITIGSFHYGIYML